MLRGERRSIEENKGAPLKLAARIADMCSMTARRLAFLTVLSTVFALALSLAVAWN
jgi:hypothetical protein